LQAHREKNNNHHTLNFLLFPILTYPFFSIHIISVKIFNCVKIKIVAPLILVVKALLGIDMVGDSDKGTAWYITYNKNNQISWWYALLSPRIEINIPEIIKYFRGK
jgi:hypothetical protein